MACTAAWSRVDSKPAYLPIQALSATAWSTVLPAFCAALANRYARHIERLRTIVLDQGEDAGDVSKLRTELRQYQQARKLLARAGMLDGPVLPDWLELD